MNDVETWHALSSIGWPGAFVIAVVVIAVAYAIGQFFKAMKG